MNAPVYLDNNATTRIDPEVLEAMLPFLTEHYANPSSGYRFARSARSAVATAREQVADLLGAHPEEILFTSGGTEADNTALASAALDRPGRNGILHSTVEHPAVSAFAEHLQQRHGCRTRTVVVGPDGLLDLAGLEELLDPEHTAVLSLMWANNETGVLFPVRAAAALAAERGIFFHTDAVQAIGKVPVSVRDSGIHFLALSAHKFHGPKGVGALYASSRVRLRPRIVGGGQEQGRRGGTENVAGIAGLGKAAELARRHVESAGEVRQLRDRFETGLRERVPGVRINGDPEERLPNTSNLAFDQLEAEGLLVLLDQAGLCASGGAACHTGALHPSPVLAAMGCSRERALASVRFSFSRFNTAEEVEHAIGTIAAAVAKLRALRDPASPVRRAAPAP